MGVLSLVIISLCFHFVTFVVSTPVQRLCPVGQFLDEMTGLCEPCSGICYLETVQGTPELCQKLCPEYVAVPKNDVSAGGQTTKKHELCPPGTYLDHTVLRCESCALFCDEKTPMGTEEDCKNKCPDYLKESSSVLPRHSMGVLLWTLVGALSVIFVTMVLVILIKFCRISSARSSQGRPVAPFIVPYIKLAEEKPKQRVDQWLTLLHESPPETDSCYGSKGSLIYNPVKTKI